MILCSHIDPPPLYNQYKFRAHLSPPHPNLPCCLYSPIYARVRLCTKLKVTSENSDYGISGSHLGFRSILFGHQKVMRFPGKRHSTDRFLSRGVTKYITVWKSWLQFDYRFFTFSFGMQMLSGIYLFKKLLLLKMCESRESSRDLKSYHSMETFLDRFYYFGQV